MRSFPRTKYRCSATRQRNATFPLYEGLCQVIVVVELHHGRPAGAAYSVQFSVPPYQAYLVIQSGLTRARRITLAGCAVQQDERFRNELI